ncbi:T1SS-143 repeat domain-containing protein, partial [Vibrio genomosp. F10 str. 9ZC157]
MPLSVTIADDIATIDDTTDSSGFSLNENSISNNSAQVSGDFVTTQGADGVESYQLDNLVSAAENLYSSGHKVTIEEVTGTANTTHYQGVANGKTIFTLSLGDDGAYTFTLLEPLDHLNDATSLTIPFDVVAVDRDGDASKAFDLPIKIVDDTPDLSGFTGEQLVDEDDLSGIGSDQRTDPLNDTVISGQFNINEGADGVVEYRLVDASATIKDLTSGQEPLEWGTSSQSGTTFTYTAQTTSGTPIFNIVFDAADNRYQFELLGPIDHPIANSEDSIQLDFSVVAIDFDGDVSNSISLPITITDDVPTIAVVEIVRVEGAGFDDITVNMFEASNDAGADGAKLTQIEGTTSNGATIVFGNSYQSSINLRDGEQNVRVYEQINDASGDTETRQLGVLRINSNGEIDFRASNYLEHDGNDINFSINVTATDGDLDTSIAPVNITITDREASPVRLKVTTFEDAGRDPDIKYASGDAPEAENDLDNQQGLADTPAQISLKVNLHDDDNDESIGSLTIKEGDHHGTFYYLKDGVFHQLEADPVTENIVFDGSVLQQSTSLVGNNTIATIDNLYFVPDKNYSAGNVTIRYQVEIDKEGGNATPVDSNFRIEIKSVADIATWNDDRSTYYYEADEDDSNVRLQLRAESQDTSRPETITYQLRVTQGEGNFELLDRNGSVITPENGVYIIASNQINRISVNPNDDFSGQIRFEATAVTKERSNSHSVDKSTAVSEPQELIIDVTPSADSGNFGVKRIQINEDNIADPNDYESDDNYKPFTLDQVITMAPSVDADGSETLYVRISEVTQNAELVWKGNGDSQIENIEIDGVVYAEIPFDQLSNVHVVPEKHSNEDFTFKVTGVIKDSATLSGGDIIDEEVMGSKVVNVEVKGVADNPGGERFRGDWENFVDGDVQGLQTTIDESQDGKNFAVLDFSIISGERADKPLDDSESVTVLLSNIPAGVVIEDSDGTEIDLNFVGYDSLGQPIYEANITGGNNNSGIIIRPVDSSTENIHVTANIIVTENDGHTHIFSQEIRVKVVPVIDATSEYETTSLGNEDSPINIHWHPEGVNYIDSDEHFTAIMIENIPVGAQVIVNNASVNMNVIDVMDSNGMVVSQTLTIDPNGLSPSEFTDIAMNSGFIQIVPPKDSSSDFELSTTVKIEERDHEYTSDGIIGEGGRVTATLTGTVNVVVRAIVEPEDDDNKLTVTNENGDIDYSPVTNGDGELEYPPISADDKGVIRFTTNSENPSLSGEYVVKYNETDQSSEEVVGDVIIQLTHTNGTALEDSVIDQLLVTGAAYEGNGRWIITNEAAFSISAPRGLDLTPNDETDANTVNQLQLKIETLVSDKGEDANERSPNEFRSTSVNLEFPETVAPGAEVAAKTTIAPDSVIDATEDIQVNLGEQLDSIITFSNKDGSQDEVTIIIDDSVTIDGVTYPISIGGAEEDFVNGQYVFQTHISESGDVGSLNGLTLTLPKDFSGDFRLPITVITKDTTSGDTNVESGNVIIHVDPIADVVGSNPKITLEVLGSLDDDMNAIDQDDNGQPDKVGYEDSYIQLDLGYQLADQVSGIEGGQEALSTVTITLPDNPSVGAFYAPDGSKIGTSLTFDPTQISNGALSNILFRANPNYPGDDDQNEVTLTISGTVTDTAVFDELEPTTSSEHSDTFTTTASFNVIPVVDDIVVTDTDGNPLVDENGEPVKEIQITTNEDQVVSLGSLLSPVAISLIDLDGSEQFVSLKLTGVPEGFFLLADSGYTVKNNGDGVWSVKIPSDAGASVDLGAISVQPPKNFSGTAEFGIAVFTQESLLGVPTLATDLPKFVLDVMPVGDDIDVDATDSVAGSEGINIDIDINASVVDKVDSISGSGIYSENGPEVLRVEVTGVPDNASIYYSDGTTLATFDSAAKVWTLDIPAQQLDKIVFNSGEHNSDDGSVLGITNPLTITIQSVDKDAENGEHLGDPVTINVALDIDPINDQP